MELKRFFAQTMKEALRRVSEQMGPDAVIVSNRRIDGGVEIVTALDYDENMARELQDTQAFRTAGGAGRLPVAVQQTLTERLQALGLTSELAGSISRRHTAGDLEEVWRQSLKMLCIGIRTSAMEWPDEGGVYALVGPTGAGKTTTIGKLAARCARAYGPNSLVLVTTDRYRVAAHEQLFAFGRNLNVPVRVVDQHHTLDDLLDDLSDRHLVLIDTAGLTSADRGYQEQLTDLIHSGQEIKTHLVVPATSQPRIMKSAWHCYRMANLAGCLLTKIDEALTLGESLGFVMETGLPVAYYTNGQKIPEDLHRAEAVPLVRQAVARFKSLRQQQAVAEGA